MLRSNLSPLVERFVQELTAAIEANVLETVRAALGTAAQPGRAPRGASVTRSAVRGRGQKRDPKQLEALSQRLRAYIAKHPGERIEQIGKGLGIPTKELALPAKKLLAAKEIATKGQKRATTYFPKG